MRVCEQLKPKKVFEYFEDLCQIPHGSGNTRQISDYCAAFAKSHGLKYIQDEDNNVIIFKDGSKGYENADPVIIQGHLDMVCEKESGVDIDFEKDGLRLYVDGDFLKAEGTTLGGDDGIAVAYALAILDDDTLEHPPLEVVFTVDEEIGLLGAESVDLSMLKGKKLLNIDSEEEGVFLTSCAGGLGAVCELPLNRTEQEGVCYEIKVTGLQGGHSGAEIHKEHGNAIVLIGRVLQSLNLKLPFAIERLEGGLKDNAIPRETAAVIMLPANGQEQELYAQIAEQEEKLKKEYHTSDPDVSIQCRKLGEQKKLVLHSSSATKVLFFLRNMPNGIQHMSMDIPGLVETSLNAGIMRMSDQTFSVSFSVRSSVTSRKYELTDRLAFLIEFLGGSISVNGDYPAWEYKKESKIRSLMAETYQDLFQKEARFEAIHAGLECGILSGKIEDLDCISFGPDLMDIHTPKERLRISSAERIWNLIIEFLKRSR
ncbi:MAG: aminoacyl-histidine dipeptidase [Lachnospiraceae bacterium]|nr:aminoacyl-histidine dipeptidase [Lachnospiraceae bacterium]